MTIQNILFSVLLAGQSLPTAGEILQRAMETAARSEAIKPESRYTFRVTSRSVRLDGDERVRHTEQQVHENRVLDGEPFLRLVEKDDRALSPQQEQREDEREQIARAKLADAKDPDIRFDEDLVRRFRVTLIGVETLSDRASYALSFEPFSGRLPERGRLDRIINRARGTIWIDVATYEISRVRFELSENVSFAAGLLGKLDELHGELARAPITEDVWMPRQLRLRIKGRAFLRRFHEVEDVIWRDFEEAVR